MSIHYQQRLVAFIDILGFRQLISGSKQDNAKIDLLYQVLQYLKTWEAPEEWGSRLIAVEEDAQKKGLEHFKIEGRTACTCFSDSIAVSVLTQEDLLNEIASTFIANLAFIGSKLLKAGILLRGGITQGDLIHTDRGIIMGQALIDAYQLEQRTARYPRIILSGKVLGKLNYPLLSHDNRYPYHQYLQRFDDGCVGLHQMIYYQVMETAIPSNLLKHDLSMIRGNIIAGLDSTFEDTEVFNIYKWLATQYNELIILDHKNKCTIYSVNDASNSHNIHFSTIDRLRNTPQSQGGLGLPPK